MDLSAANRDEIVRALDGREPQAVAETAVELVVGLFQADVAALWWFLEDVGARLVARTPPLDRKRVRPAESPPVAAFSPMDEPRFVRRGEVTPSVASFMDAHDLDAAFLLPFRVDDLGRWLLSLGWCEPPDEEPPIDVAALNGFTARLEATLLRATERKLRDESHLELADNVAQALVVANTLHEMGDPEAANRAVIRALDHTKAVMARLHRDNPSETFVRLYPSSVEVVDPDPTS